MARDSGYNTKQRELINVAVKSFGSNHFTVDELVANLHSNNINVGITTVYRSLERMAQQGMLRKFASVEGKSACWQYIESPGECSNHFHLHCKECGKLFHCECEYLDEMGGHIMEHHGFAIDASATVFLGVCEDCNKSNQHV